MSNGGTHTGTHTYTPPTYISPVFLSTLKVSTFLTRLGRYHGNQTDNWHSQPLSLSPKPPLSVFFYVFVSQALLRSRSFTLSKQELRSPANLFTTIQMWRFGCSTDRERERVTLIAASLFGAIIFSLWHPFLLPSLCLSSVAPSLLLRSNIIWVQLTSLKSPGCFKRRELEGRQMQGEREEEGETEGRGGRRRQWKKGRRERQRGSARRRNESQCHQRWGGGRCVWPH